MLPSLAKSMDLNRDEGTMATGSVSKYLLSRCAIAVVLTPSQLACPSSACSFSSSSSYCDAQQIMDDLRVL